MFTADVLGRCFPRAGASVCFVCLTKSSHGLLDVCVFYHECVWPGVIPPERIEVFNFLSFFHTEALFSYGGEYRVEILRYIERAL